MTSYQQIMLKIAEAETKYDFISIEKEMISRYVTESLTLDEYIKLDNRSTDLYTAIYWS
tara:strand:+ start:228 stop:404 length:177 start_codon:yes stop_codon:yes gene_type:complete